MPTLTVVLSVFKDARLLGRQLDSQARQVRTPEAVIVRDDHFYDASPLDPKNAPRHDSFLYRNRLLR